MVRASIAYTGPIDTGTIGITVAVSRARVPGIAGVALKATAGGAVAARLKSVG